MAKKKHASVLSILQELQGAPTSFFIVLSGAAADTSGKLVLCGWDPSKQLKHSAVATIHDYYRTWHIKGRPYPDLVTRRWGSYFRGRGLQQLRQGIPPFLALAREIWMVAACGILYNLELEYIGRSEFAKDDASRIQATAYYILHHK
ncbi:hypothetical protein HYPSUDRAFT_332379 [Hypholoma sublateritium FD-334 SS-4]|uniref:Uncharacterized protein n=1 Tax=Hypholoma sublateritium (strain FD-334 SS-4) TaxID=945553 RepID=A0A0D2LYD4_HYPSF|nr:hypothetical protein HYPSUDRAFT_332379 [Hypholoma sublateritium FD-334 SS-4]